MEYISAYFPVELCFILKRISFQAILQAKNFIVNNK